MFNPKTKSQQEEVTGSGTTIIGAGTLIKGDIESNGDIRIDGTLVGNVISTAKVLIGSGGTVQGDLKGEQADVLGNVSGKIKINDLLQLRGNASVKGDIYAGKLQIEPSVTFNGQCHMGANVVELNSDASTVAVNE
ncbi:bactofilin family protein [Ferruginibacter sp. SUN002]|uniref:bactofilin family protein n=1 Tax=Ferruginibacter sp. SUN002 TaxID=2937789 RepID=UPI003D35C7E8